MTIFGLSVYKHFVPICRAQRSNVFGHRHWELMFGCPRFVQVLSTWATRLSIETNCGLRTDPVLGVYNVSIFQLRLIVASGQAQNQVRVFNVSIFQSRLTAGFRANPAAPKLLRASLRHLRGAHHLEQRLCRGEQRLWSKGRPIWLS